MENGLFEVLGIDEVHTCRGKNRHDLSRPRLHPAKKIHKLKDEVSEEEQKRMELQREREREQRGRKSHEGVLSDGSEEENSVMVESTYDRAQPMSKASWKSRTRSGNLEEEDENENSSETGSEARISTIPTWKETLPLRKEAKEGRGRTTSGLRQYPRADEVQAEIQGLLSVSRSDTLPAPASTQLTISRSTIRRVTFCFRTSRIDSLPLGNSSSGSTLTLSNEGSPFAVAVDPISQISSGSAVIDPIKATKIK